MTHEARIWLPPARPGDIERVLARLAEDWLARWLCEPSRCHVEPAVTTGSPALEWHGREGAAIGSEEAMMVLLGYGVLAGQADPGNPRDAELLKAVGRNAFTDLVLELCRIGNCESIADAVAAEGPHAGLARYAIDLPRLGWRAQVGIDEEVAARLRRNCAGTSRKPRLASFDAALAEEPISLGCQLGHASLSALELSDLARGDLLVLDRAASEVMPLTFDSRAASSGSARIAEQAGELILQIIDPPSPSPNNAEAQ